MASQTKCRMQSGSTYVIIEIPALLVNLVLLLLSLLHDRGGSGNCGPVSHYVHMLLYNDIVIGKCV